jgi:magnesium transporter
MERPNRGAAVRRLRLSADSDQRKQNRNHIPRVHVYPNHVFIVVHASEIGAGGHVHYLELDQLVGEDFLVTVHGPLNPKVPLQAALRETQAVAARMKTGRLRPTSPFGLT